MRLSLLEIASIFVRYGGLVFGGALALGLAAAAIGVW